MPSTSTAQLPSVEQHVNAAFVQFVRPESAANFCEAYSKNWPIKHVYKRRKVRKAKRGLTGRRRDRALTENRTGHEVVAETKQSRKRKRVTSGRVSDEETPLKRSRSSFDIAGYAETVDGSKEEAHEDGQLQQMRDKNISNRADQESIPSGTINVGVAHERKRYFLEPF
ncbi:unnamed protein product [Toxocara canis]|uniref:RRM domain-containing protein n=1 Tax=Toxocara canis TaxID=6265 RepID=A0A183U4Q3_TOXCA|nr:unnamed protein product [Toxocara canis]